MSCGNVHWPNLMHLETTLVTLTPDFCLGGQR